VTTVEVVWKVYVHLWENARERARAAIAAGMAELFRDDEDESGRKKLRRRLF